MAEWNSFIMSNVADEQCRATRKQKIKRFGKMHAPVLPWRLSVLG